MKLFIASCLVLCAVLGIGALTPSGVAASVRHIAVNHLPAPPLGTVEISSANPTMTPVLPTSATACAGTPPSTQVSTTTATACNPQNQTVRVDVLRLPVQ